jgi:hypothetical protein
MASGLTGNKYENMAVGLTGNKRLDYLTDLGVDTFDSVLAIKQLRLYGMTACKI